jgi:hypothetical protein
MNGLGRIAYALVFLLLGEFTPVSDSPTANSLPVNEEISFLSTSVDTTIIRRCGLNFRIFDFSCTANNNYTISVTSLPGTQLGQDLVLEEVRLIIDHDWVADLDISLRSPSGVWVEISTDNGGASNDFGDPTDLSCERLSTFSMSACTSVEAAEGPFLGNFLPEGNLMILMMAPILTVTGSSNFAMMLLAMKGGSKQSNWFSPIKSSDPLLI